MNKSISEATTEKLVCTWFFGYMRFKPANITKHSYPLPKTGKYRYDWAVSAIPKSEAVCFDEVVVYHSGSGNCCDGWIKEKIKFPRHYSDVSPYELPLCGNASRHTWFSMNIYFLK